MSVTTQPADTAGEQGLAPVCDDFSAYVIAGAVSADPSKFERETEGRTPAQGIRDGIDAEQLGFRRVLISERHDIKECDVLLAAIAAQTSRIELVTGIVIPTTRHPWLLAALGATMQCCFGPRFVLGLGRGEPGWLQGMGIPLTTYKAMSEIPDVCRRLWRGEKVSYTGQLGDFDALQAHETYPGEEPPIFFATYCHPKGAAVAAAHYDGVILPPMITPDATAAAVKRLHEACEKIGRDPSEIRIVQPVVTAPDDSVDDFEARSISTGRAVTYLQYPYYGDILAKTNGWDLGLVEKMRQHPLLTDSERVVDKTYHRHQMVEGPGSVFPWEWMLDCSAIGTVDECVTSLQRFIDAGADEVTTYGSTPRQNAKLLAAWRQRPQAKSGS